VRVECGERVSVAAESRSSQSILTKSDVIAFRDKGITGHATPAAHAVNRAQTSGRPVTPAGCSSDERVARDTVKMGFLG
jgi:hypothetical protein